MTTELSENFLMISDTGKTTVINKELLNIQVDITTQQETGETVSFANREKAQT